MIFIKLCFKSLSEGDKKYEAVMSSFSRDRESLITPLVDRKLYDEAASLAEKYREFDALVRLCEETGNKEKLEQYMDMFKDNKFSDHVFAWYVKEGKQGRLLSSTSSGRNQELGQFLAGHSGLSWLHDINTGSFQQAAETLKSLAMKVRRIISSAIVVLIYFKFRKPIFWPERKRSCLCLNLQL